MLNAALRAAGQPFAGHVRENSRGFEMPGRSTTCRERMSKTMRPAWDKLSDFCDVRRCSSFSKFSDSLADPGGRIDSWLKTIRLAPLMAHEYRCRPGWSVGPRRLLYSVWWIFPESGGWVILSDKNRRMPFKPGDLILMPEGMEHQVTLSTSRITPQYAGHFHATMFGSLNLLSFMGFPLVIPSANATLPQEAAAAMIREYEIKSTGWQSVMESELTRLLLYVVRHHGRLFGADNLKMFHINLPRLFPVFEFIEDRLHDPDLTVDDLAAHIHVSEVYLRRLFRTVTGMSVVSFVLQQRVKRACLMLYRQSHTIKQVAESCGFAGVIYFHRIFKRFTGKTPMNFVRNNLS